MTTQRTRQVRAVTLVVALLSGLVSASSAAAAPPDNPAARADDARLPRCSGGPNTGAENPPGPPGTPGVAMCSAEPTSIKADPFERGSGRGPAQQDETPVPHAGYHHLGAQSNVELGGVYGRLQVRNTGVRQGKMDFVATRFMVKQDVSGQTKWLEAGWSENGWLNDNRQHIYTYDTNNFTWRFYDQYAIADLSRIWIMITPASGCSTTCTWSAYIWWNNAWNVLSRQSLPIGGTAFVEEYIEPYSDSDGAHYSLPQIEVDNVQIYRSGAWAYWRTQVSTTAGGNVAPYCLHWEVRHDTFHAWKCQ